MAVRHTGTEVSIWDNGVTKTVDAAAQNANPFRADLAFMLFASRTISNSNNDFTTYGGAMDFYEIVIEDRAVPDADIEKAITDLAAKWGIALT